jgi:glucose/arabinose dehydrogenase
MKKIFYFTSLIIFLILAVSFYTIVNKGYDRQNKFILSIKEIIPSKFAREVRSTIFAIPNLKKKNELLTFQVKKYEQGMEGELFKEQNILSRNKKNYNIKEFYLPFKRLDLNLGWKATENSRRAHYLELVDDKVLAISGLSQTIYFLKKNINKKKLDQKNIKNNILSYLKKNDYELIGIRDLFVEDNYIYISLQHKDSKGFTINIYRAELNFKELNFKPFFITNEYWQKYNVFSGGRIETYKNNKILFSIGFSSDKSAAQNKKSLLGKIISIDKDTSKYNLISIGHRNPQGLFYEKKLDIIINSEHGPKGGDEINVNFQKAKSMPNFGWPIASYGQPYVGVDTFKKSHSKYGFIEPFKNYTPSIGVSEIFYLSNKNNFIKGKNNLFISSMRAASIYIIEIDKKFTQIINEDRLFFKEQRIRDIEFDHTQNVFFILFENTPSIGILSSNY